MAKSAIAAMSSSPSSSSSSSSLSSSPPIRFLGHFKFPEKPPDLNTTNGFELQESDVFWPSSSDRSNTSSPSSVSNSKIMHRQSKSGLYGAFSDDQRSLVRRKPSLSPSLSATTAARTIPPVALMRSTSENSGSLKYRKSAPVNVPIWRNKSGNYLGHFDEVVDEVEEEMMIPPHEIVARSYASFSVFEGAGRTLKGRDLRRVRNAVFQKTGVLD